GDVLISVQGSVGRVGVVLDALDGANISRTIARIRPVTPELMSWLATALKCPQSQSAIKAVIGGTTRDSLNIRDLRELQIAVPPLAEQDRIATKVSALLADVNSARLRLPKATTIFKRLRQSIPT